MSPRDTFLLAVAATFIILALLGVYDVPDNEIHRRRDDDPLRPRIYKLEERDE